MKLAQMRRPLSSGSNRHLNKPSYQEMPRHQRVGASQRDLCPVGGQRREPEDPAGPAGSTYTRAGQWRTDRFAHDEATTTATATRGMDSSGCACRSLETNQSA